jgi:hypothetical protein
VKERVQVGLRKALGEMVQYALSAAIASQPVVYERDLQATDASSLGLSVVLDALGRPTALIA